MKTAGTWIRNGVVALTLVCSSGLLGSGLPAAAAGPADIGAQVDYFYIYEHDDQGGGYARFSGNDYNLNNNYWTGGGGGRVVNNNASSMDNNTSRDVVMYNVSSNTGSCSGRTYNALPNSEDDDLTNNGFDNLASCIKFV